MPGLSAWVLLTGLVAAASESPLVAIGDVTPRITALSDAQQQYALFVPKAYSPDRQWPVLFVLDPRGRALPALELFVDAAARHGYIVLSSYQSRSDAPVSVTADALKALLQDAQQRLSIDPVRVYLTGMSGTSHAAWRWGMVLGANVAGVIGCAGGLPNDWEGAVESVPFAYYGIAGLGDFNYQEMRELHELLDQAGAQHRFETFEGVHGWPPSRLTNAALDWMELQALKSGLAATDAGLDVRALLERDLSRVEAIDDQAHRYLRLRQIVRDYADLLDVAEQKAQLEAAADRAEVTRALEREAKLAAREKDYFRTRFATWMRAVRAEDQLAPTLRRSLVDLRVAALQKQAAGADVPAARSAQRLIESLYSSTSFYLPNHFIEREAFDRAALSLRVAIEAHPERRRAHWRLAEVLARDGRTTEAMAALRAAIALGRVDIDRLENDDVWGPLRGSSEWPSLLQEVRRSQPRSPRP